MSVKSFTAGAAIASMIVAGGLGANQYLNTDPVEPPFSGPYTFKAPLDDADGPKVTVDGCQSPEVKGNISFKSGERIYHMPSDSFYDKTEIDTGAGERWFCTEQDAQNAGWRRAQR